MANEKSEIMRGKGWHEAIDVFVAEIPAGGIRLDVVYDGDCLTTSYHLPTGENVPLRYVTQIGWVDEWIGDVTSGRGKKTTPPSVGGCYYDEVVYISQENLARYKQDVAKWLADAPFRKKEKLEKQRKLRELLDRMSDNDNDDF